VSEAEILAEIRELRRVVDLILERLGQPLYYPGPCGSVILADRHGLDPCRCQFWDGHIGVHKCLCQQEWEDR
jgi:hypothetical protein